MEKKTPALIAAARGMVPADLVIEDTSVYNPFTCSWDRGSLAIKDGVVLGMGDYAAEQTIDGSGRYVVPGLIDAHVHIESSLLTPGEYARLVSLHGTGTVIADPHEIANVAGISGIEYMLASRTGAAIDIRYMIPSCVPATPADIGGAVISSADMQKFAGRDGIAGIGEMMNFPGVLAGDTEVLAKIAVAAVRDGHAPGLSGKDLNAYLLAGPDSDHECTTRAEAEEKLKKGMYVFIREGSAEQNIEALVPVVTPATASRCCFATDDCHADLLMEDGHIDRCIRKAVACGLAPELALRMATLSAAERFGLHDRGALAPGRRADFCITDDPETFVVSRSFSRGREITAGSPVTPAPFPPSVHCTPPASADVIRITGSGTARVIGLVPGQIVTESLQFAGNATTLPDPGRDILKLVVCNRYRDAPCGVGLVHGFGFSHGAIACSISHDAHNIVATGTSDALILQAIREVVSAKGAMVAVSRNGITVLPLDCAGLMSTLPYPEVVRRLHALHAATDEIGGIVNPFMYLSFMALTVIPALRVTDRGVFDGIAFRDVPLFS